MCVCMLDIVSMCVYVCIHVSRGACIILLELGLLAIDIAPSVYRLSDVPRLFVSDSRTISRLVYNYD